MSQDEGDDGDSKNGAAVEAEILSRLVALNRERAAEEARGLVRWLRPEYQAPEDAQPTAEILISEAERPADS